MCVSVCWYVNILSVSILVPACMCVCVFNCLWTPWERPWKDNGPGDAWEFSVMLS